MIRRLLIANRGEIALRIVHACRELGIESVAIYSDVDADSPYVEAADRAVPIGPAPAVESYLATEKVIDAARSSGADAIHPGYGFLSENASFAAACTDAGIVFIGPPADVIARMGSKIEARRLMEKAGVPTVPGKTPEDQTDAGICDAVRQVGFPALVKASGGGGGKGMRRINDPGEIETAVQAARREASAGFRDGCLYVERLVEFPRHIEVQVFADDHGHTVHLFERDCSTQRRYQKVIEESPSPRLTPAVRDKITKAAVQAAMAAGYRNAGTIEFLVEGNGDSAVFYFLEMNTRLQVEHPVTESVTGTDLVRAQILVASGEVLPWKQGSLTQRGHAIECRIYAEDPAQGFIPQAGRLLLYREPRMPGVRIDSGVKEGGEVSVYYDPMLAKLIATGETREHARARAMAALRSYPILGIGTNIAFLLQILQDERFIKGKIDTGFLDREGAALAAKTSLEAPNAALAAAAAYQGMVTAPGDGKTSGANPRCDPWSRLQGWRG
jgi:3-methylcrotonyl-CoA carboxylase alpha subunit